MARSSPVVVSPGVAPEKASSPEFHGSPARDNHVNIEYHRVTYINFQNGKCSNFLLSLQAVWRIGFGCGIVLEVVFCSRGCIKHELTILLG